MDKMEQKELFSFINQVSFMLDDITLFLNTHPNCKEAMESYEHFMKLRKDAVSEYTKLFGPICRYDVDICNYWDWVNKPWPWEGECYC